MDVHDSNPPNLLVIGDLILDQYVLGAIHRNSPDANVPVVNQERSKWFPGGAANVACNLVALGSRVVLIGAVGEDDEGQRLLSLLNSAKVDVSAVQVIKDRPTCLKTRVIGNQEHIVRIDREVTVPLEEKHQVVALDTLQQKLPQSRGILCSDYDKGVLCKPLLAALMRAANARDKPVIVDPKNKECSHYRGASVLTPNLQELHLLSGLHPVNSSSDVDRAAQAVMSRIHPQAVLATCGADGMVLYEPNGRRMKVPGSGSVARDVNGAGDSSIAAFAWGYLVRGYSLEAAAFVANSAGSIAVTKFGTAIVTEAELETPSFKTVAADKPDTPLQKRSKVVNLSQLLRHLETVRQLDSQTQVVFTNGCFDLLHVGHNEYLQTARRQGNLLVVGLNSDASIQRLKGNKRPILPQGQRADMLAALECVDFVVIFEEDTPLPLIQAIQPGILVKGGDYLPHQVVGRDVVEASGGHLELVPFKTEVSTSTVIQKIVDCYGGE
ncbi:hypothetical protein FE257_001431 [Aspergillus nanangensis]|uniref:D-glycero-beta-D-manno-heptose 1-phosphate adenylyltransferase n=1 Tax=Aspergillus nanangensis TaxID=2582783 RepID=A0AAD4GNW5_ASPNN|nr:hypothetical protein FE257_001431 [Aspergillus nanangensis]